MAGHSSSQNNISMASILLLSILFIFDCEADPKLMWGTNDPDTTSLTYIASSQFSNIPLHEGDKITVWQLDKSFDFILHFFKGDLLNPHWQGVTGNVKHNVFISFNQMAKNQASGGYGQADNIKLPPLYDSDGVEYVFNTEGSQSKPQKAFFHYFSFDKNTNKYTPRIGYGRQIFGRTNGVWDNVLTPLFTKLEPKKKEDEQQQVGSTSGNGALPDTIRARKQMYNQLIFDEYQQNEQQQEELRRKQIAIKLRNDEKLLRQLQRVVHRRYTD